MSAPDPIDDLAMLAEFAQLAMARARAAASRAEALEGEGGDPLPHLLAFDRMGRAMRLALSLRRRFAGEAAAEAAQRVQARKERLRAALTPAICVQADTYERRRLEWELAQRLETEAEALASLPLAAGVTRLRQILGLPAFAPFHADAQAASDPCAPSVSALRADPPPPLRRGGAEATSSSPEGNTSGDAARLAQRDVTEGAQAPNAIAGLAPGRVARARVVAAEAFPSPRATGPP